MPWNPDRPVVPMSQEGWMLSYPDYSTRMTEVEPFVASMVILKYSRGRSSIQFELMDITTGRHYPIFVSDFVELVQTTSIYKGHTPRLRWTYVKKGSNYGIKVDTNQEGVVD